MSVLIKAAQRSPNAIGLLLVAAIELISSTETPISTEADSSKKLPVPAEHPSFIA